MTTAAVAPPKNRKLLIAIMCASYTIYGLVNGMRGLTLTLIKAEYDISYRLQGFMVLISSLACTAMIILAAFLLSRFGIKPAVVGSFSLILLCSLVSYVTSAFIPTLIVYALLIAGNSYQQVGVNAMSSRIFVTRITFQLGLLNATFGIGSILGPRVANLLIARFGASWRELYLFLSALCLVFLAITLATRFSTIDDRKAAVSVETDAPRRQTMWGMMRTPRPWLFALPFLFSYSIETVMANYTVQYLQDVWGLDAVTTGTTFMSIYFLLYTGTRIAFGWLGDKIGCFNVLKGGAVALCAVFVTSLALGRNGVWLLCLTGMLISLFFMNQNALAIKAWGREAPLIIAAGSVLYNLGAAGTQYGIGFLNDVLGPRSIMFAMPVLAALLFVALLVYQRWMKTQGHGQL